MSGQIKEFEIIESKAYIVHATNEEDALAKFGNYEIVQEGDFWPTVRELGTVPDDMIDVVLYR
jgi:hypothetical protein